MKILAYFSLPENYQAAQLTAPGAELQLISKKFDALQKGEVWVQIKASPINPSDLAMLGGSYPHNKTYPFVPGLEASGIVVASGGGLMANYMLGKRVACSPPENGDGTWAEFMKAPAGKCVPLSGALSFTEGASALVNPLTALALIKKAQSTGKSFVNTAAAGALGQMLIKLATKENVTAINIVRDTKHIQKLKAIGAEIVLDSSSSTFNKEYQNACKKHTARCILDAVGGGFTKQLLDGALPHTRLIAYATLSKEDIVISPQSIIREGNTIEGFHLGTWLASQPFHTKLQLTRKAQKFIADGTLATKTHKTFALKNLNAEIAAYQENMSQGKHILLF